MIKKSTVWGQVFFLSLIAFLCLSVYSAFQTKNFWIVSALLVSGSVSAVFIYIKMYKVLHKLKLTETILAKINNGDLKSLQDSGKGSLQHCSSEASSLYTTFLSITKHLKAEYSTLDSTSEELTLIAGDITEGAEKLKLESNTLAAASEELSSNINSLAAAAEELSTSSDSVAAASEQMTNSINEVYKNSEHGTHIVNEVSRQALEAQRYISEMDQAASQIGSIVEVIQDIADQTNLLALNAAIEAAGAGDAGKGFAVVANEVKALARQSYEASNQITSQIELVQQRTQTAISIIQKVFESLQEVTKTTNSIAEAIKEQTSTSKEIAYSIAAVSTTTKETTRNIQEAAVASSSVSRMSLNLGELAQKTTLISSQMVIGVDAIQSAGNSLKNIAGRYNTNEPAFDIFKVKAAHMKWVERLQNLLRGQINLTPDEVTVYTACDLGKWLYRDAGKQFATEPAYALVDSFHKDVHVTAHEIVKLYNQKKFDDARKKMEEFEKFRNKLFFHLNELYQSA
jgi:methyl-accepting chemotaxis protein